MIVNSRNLEVQPSPPPCRQDRLGMPFAIGVRLTLASASWSYCARNDVGLRGLALKFATLQYHSLPFVCGESLVVLLCFPSVDPSETATRKTGED